MATREDLYVASLRDARRVEVKLPEPWNPVIAIPVDVETNMYSTELRIDFPKGMPKIGPEAAHIVLTPVNGGDQIWVDLQAAMARGLETTERAGLWLAACVMLAGSLAVAAIFLLA